MNTQNSQNVIFSETLFTNSLGEKLSLQEISGKDVLKIKIMYLANPKKFVSRESLDILKKANYPRGERTNHCERKNNSSHPNLRSLLH